VKFGAASLGFKLNLALFLFVIVLGVATSAIVLYGFSRTQDDAQRRSQEALEEQGKLALQALAGGVADAGVLQFETAGAIGQRAGRYLQDFRASGATPAYDTARFERTPDGVWYDPDPDRISDVVVVNHQELEGAVLDDIAYSAALDPILPALAEPYPGEIGGAAYRPIAIIFVSVNGVGRSYPPIGIQENTPAEIDVSDFYERFGPEANPDRETVWTAPYEDLRGSGLVMTAQTPVYEGDTFRGIFEVDLSIAELVALVNLLKPTPGGFTFYVDREGEIMETDAFELVSGEAAENAELAAVLDAMKAPTAEPGVFVETVTLDGEDFFVAYTSMPLPGGSLAVAAPVDEVTAQAAEITAGIEDEGNRTFVVMLVAMAALFVVGLAGASYLNRSLLLVPLRRLFAATDAVAAGDLGTKVELARNDELGTLAESFNTMVAKLRESERRLAQQVEERTRELSALLEVSRAVASTLEGRAVVATILDQLGAVTEHTGASILLAREDAFEVVEGRSITGSRAEVGARIPFHVAPVLSAAMTSGQTVIIDDVQADEPLAADYRASINSIGLLDQPPFNVIRSWMAVPLAHKDRTLGMLTLSWTEPAYFTEDHARLARAFADQAAVAMENARLFEQAGQVAAIEERQRLARELHDSVSQALYGIALGARTAKTQLERDPAKAAEPVDYILSLAEAGLAEMRSLIFELRPESLATEGLVAALDKQVAAGRARYGIAIDADIGDEPDAPLETKEALYRIAQEALHNVVKHARATHVTLSLAREDSTLKLQIVDNGAGFDPGADFAGHLGLKSMRERAALLGGTLEVTSGAGQGTTIIATLPV
jgi:signal transduction histidine kinase